MTQKLSVLPLITGILGLRPTLACNGNQACQDAGLAGEALNINQDLQILIDITAASRHLRS